MSTRRQFCDADVLRRRRISRKLDELLREMYPPTAPEPCTFGLDVDQLRRHANRLHSAGWSLEEIRAVLDVEPARSA